jgi:hypothetical protein
MDGICFSQSGSHRHPILTDPPYGDSLTQGYPDEAGPSNPQGLLNPRIGAPNAGVIGNLWRSSTAPLGYAGVLVYNAQGKLISRNPIAGGVPISASADRSATIC